MADEYLSKLVQIGQTAIARLHVRSALNPILWLCLIAGLVFLSGAYLFRDDPFLKYLLVTIAVIPTLVACYGFVFFSLTKPEKLQSEDYQIRHEAIQVIQSKSGRISNPSVPLEAIANPKARLIGMGGEQE
jgi:hypothetical protein